MKPVHRSLCLFFVSGFIVATCGLMLAKWAALPTEYPYLSAVEAHYVWRDEADRVFVFDGQLGKIARGFSKDYPLARDMLCDGSYLHEEQSLNSNPGSVVTVIDPQTHQEIRRFQISSYLPSFVAGRRYLVRSNGQILEAYDLTQDDPQPMHTALPVPGTSCEVSGLWDSSRVVVLSPLPAGAIVQLFDLEPSGFALRAGWSVGMPGHVYEKGDSVTVVNLAGDGLERRSLENGEVIESYPLPAGFDVAATDSVFTKYYVSTVDKNNHIRHYHAATGRELDLGTSTYISAEIPGTSLGLFATYDSYDQRVFMVDKAANAVRWTFHIPRSTSFSADITANGQISVTSSRLGLTAYELDVESGHVIRKMQPFFWTPWALMAVCLSTVAWFVGWRRFLVSHQWSVWWEVYALLIWVLGVMTFRMWYMYGSNDFLRTPAAIGYAITLASLQVTVLWIWVGRGRIIDRLVHMVAVLIIVGLSFRILHASANYEWPSILISYFAFPVVTVLLTPLVLSRTRGFKQLREQCKRESVREVYPMKTMLAVTTWSALFAAVYNSFVPSLGMVQFAELSYGYFGAGAAIALIATWAALCGHPLVLRTAATVALLLILALMIFVLNEVVLGNDPFYQYRTPRFRILALSLTFSLTFWLVASPAWKTRLNPPAAFGSFGRVDERSVVGEG